MNRIEKKSSSKKRLLFVGLALFLIAAASAGAWYYLNSKSTEKDSNDIISSSTKDDTKTPDVDTPVIPVPDDVDPSDIKPYTTLTENETYKIRQLDNKYVITLYAIINRPAQSEQYYDQLRQYKQDALKYLKEKSINVNDVEIQYEPAEAANL